MVGQEDRSAEVRGKLSEQISHNGQSARRPADGNGARHCGLRHGAPDGIVKVMRDWRRFVVATEMSTQALRYGSVPEPVLGNSSLNLRYRPSLQ